MATDALGGGGALATTGLFDIPGDPGSIRVSVAQHAAHARVQEQQAEAVTAVRFADWVADEADAFVAKKNALPPLMRDAATAITTTAERSGTSATRSSRRRSRWRPSRMNTPPR